MTSTRILKHLKAKLQFPCCLMEIQTYDTPVMLALKDFTRTFFLSSKSSKNLFLACLVFSLLIEHKYGVLRFKTSKS